MSALGLTFYCRGFVSLMLDDLGVNWILGKSSVENCEMSPGIFVYPGFESRGSLCFNYGSLGF